MPSTTLCNLRSLAALLIAVFALGTASAPVSAQLVGGRYSVDGTSPDGRPYVGEVRIAGVTGKTCRMTWQTEVKNTKGICQFSGTQLTTEFVFGDAKAIASYTVLPDGSLDGVWRVDGQDGAGRERLSRRP